MKRVLSAYCRNGPHRYELAFRIESFNDAAAAEVLRVAMRYESYVKYWWTERIAGETFGQSRAPLPPFDFLPCLNSIKGDWNG